MAEMKLYYVYDNEALECGVMICAKDAESAKKLGCEVLGLFSSEGLKTEHIEKHKITLPDYSDYFPETHWCHQCDTIFPEGHAMAEYYLCQACSRTGTREHRV